MKLQYRERLHVSPRDRLTAEGRKAAQWSTWKDCEGTEGLAYQECRELVREWLADPTPGFSEQFRIVP